MKKKILSSYDSGDDFFEETTLHGFKYIKKSGTSRILWVAVLVASVAYSYTITSSTLHEFLHSPMRILVNSTTTPITPADFPVFTVCNINLVSRTNQKALMFAGRNLSTYKDAKDFAQDCIHMIPMCYYNNAVDCTTLIRTVLTDNGWCCQINVQEINDLYGMIPTYGEVSGLHVAMDVQTYDYALPSWYGEGLSVVVGPSHTYPEMLNRATFLAPGTTNYIQMRLTATFTTEDALEKSPEVRNCFVEGEYPLKFFNEYSQTNCIVESAIRSITEKCGCIGKYRGDNVNASSSWPECTIRGSISWMDKMEFEECIANGTTRQEVLQSMGCPSQCLARCDDVSLSVELSSAKVPGFNAFCGNSGPIAQNLICLLSVTGASIGAYVCDTLTLYELTEDAKYLEKFQQLCPPLMLRVWKACNETMMKTGFTNMEELTTCLNETLALTEAEIAELEDVVLDYVRENIVSLYVTFKDMTYTSMKRDVSYTLPSLIANIGGLLGLCMGCSMVSLFEVVFFMFKNLSACRTSRKKQEVVDGDLLSGKFKQRP